MSQKRSLFLSLLTAIVIAVSAPAAMANHIDTANATVTCTNYTLNVTASDLIPGRSYTINYTIILTPTSGGSVITVTDSISFTGPANGKFSGTVSKPVGPLSTDYTLSGWATLVGHNTIAISFSSNTVSCSTPCTGSSSNSSDFNGTPIKGDDYIWFNANFTAKGIPSAGATITFTNSTISAIVNGTQYNLSVPNAQITFSPSATCTSTTFDTVTNTWMTIVPVSGDDEIFLTGLAVQVPSGGLPGGINPVEWEGTFAVTTDTPGISIDWKWGAAVYSSFTTNYNALAIKPGHKTACGMNNGDHAGTPEGVNGNNQPWKQFVAGGARGGGGSNWTGSWSGTLSVTLVCQSSQLRQTTGVEDLLAMRR
jgi:hypothetical protein